MVCRNCGAELKPGIKYCLECGNYVDDDANNLDGNSGGGTMNGNPSYTFKTTKKKRRKKKKKNNNTWIYILLGLVIVICIIVIIFTIVNDNKRKQVEPIPTIETDTTLGIDNYRVTVPAGYLHKVDGSVLFVSDDVNYTFSYRNTTDDYDLYAEDLKVVTKELEDNKYEVYTAEKKNVDGVEFLCFKLKANGSIKYLYLTKASKYYTSLGVIEALENGDWELALPVIAKLNEHIEFTSTPDFEEEDDDDDKLVGGTTEEIISSSSSSSSSLDTQDGPLDGPENPPRRENSAVNELIGGLKEGIKNLK